MKWLKPMSEYQRRREMKTRKGLLNTSMPTHRHRQIKKNKKNKQKIQSNKEKN